MDIRRLLVVLLLFFMIVVDRLDGLKFRKLATSEAPNASSNAIQDSPVPSPLPNGDKSNLTSINEKKPKDAHDTNQSDADSKGLDNTNDKTKSKDSGDKELDKGKSQDDKQKADNTGQSDAAANESCKGIPSCSDQGKTMTACIRNAENGSNNMTLLVQNEGDITLKVNLTVVASSNYSKPAFEIPGHTMEKVNFTYTLQESAKMIVNAGNGDCVLHIDAPKTKTVDKNKDGPSKSKSADVPSKSNDINSPSKAKDVDGSSKPKDVDDHSKSKDLDDPSKSKDVDDPSKSKDVDDPSKSKDVDGNSKAKNVDDLSKSKDVSNPPNPKNVKDPPTPAGVNVPISQSNFLKQFSAYSKQVTPMYGAYFAFLVALVIGGTWACCSFRKRRSDGGVPYQELEMGLGLPESSNVETAESWDQDWDDDDWDEDKAIRSPGGGLRPKTISSNGLTSRTPKKDGWDAAWDD